MRKSFTLGLLLVLLAGMAGATAALAKKRPPQRATEARRDTLVTGQAKHPGGGSNSK